MIVTKFAIVIPTLNAGKDFNLLLDSIKQQTLQPSKLLIIDSQSTDNTVNIAKEHGWEVRFIQRSEFNHGGTRQQGADLVSSDYDIVIYLTQDAIIADPMSLEKLVQSFVLNDKIGAAYGRQLPHVNSGLIGTHARLFNYPDERRLKTLSDATTLGIKTAFISNSFAAYRTKTLKAVGGFPHHTILSEDTFVAAKMLIAGYAIDYCAEATVYHSHDYSFINEFKRYFDIGVFHAREPWIRDKFGNAEGEGLKYILSEMKYLIKYGKGYLLPSVFIRTCLKYLGYRLGMKEQKIPVVIKKHISMHRRYWDKSNNRLTAWEN